MCFPPARGQLTSGPRRRGMGSQPTNGKRQPGLAGKENSEWVMACWPSLCCAWIFKGALSAVRWAGRAPVGCGRSGACRPRRPADSPGLSAAKHRSVLSAARILLVLLLMSFSFLSFSLPSFFFLSFHVFLLVFFSQRSRHSRMGLSVGVVGTGGARGVGASLALCAIYRWRWCDAFFIQAYHPPFSWQVDVVTMLGL